MKVRVALRLAVDFVRFFFDELSLDSVTTKPAFIDVKASHEVNLLVSSLYRRYVLERNSGREGIFGSKKRIR